MRNVLPKVKRIINMSLKQAKYYGDDVVRIEHIVISLINDYNNNAIKTLLKMGVDVDKLHKKIEKKLMMEKDDFTQVKTTSKDIPLDNVTENILKGAEKECDGLNDSYLDTQHILLATIKVKSDMSNIFKNMKISYRKCKSNVVSSIEPAETDGEGSGYKKRKSKSSSKNRGDEWRRTRSFANSF